MNDLFSPENQVSGNQGGELVKFAAPGQRFIGTFVGSHETAFERGPVKHYDFVHCTVFGVSKDPYATFTLRDCAMLKKGMALVQPGWVVGIEYLGTTPPVMGQNGMVQKNGTHLYNVFSSQAHVDKDWQKYASGEVDAADAFAAQPAAALAPFQSKVGGIPVEQAFSENVTAVQEPFPTNSREIHQKIMAIASGKMGAANENEAFLKVGQLTGLAMVEANYGTILAKLQATYGA